MKAPKFTDAEDLFRELAQVARVELPPQIFPPDADLHQRVGAELRVECCRCTVNLWFLASKVDDDGWFWCPSCADATDPERGRIGMGLSVCARRRAPMSIEKEDR